MPLLLYPLLIVIAVLGTAILAFTQCAIAELVLKLAVWLWSPDGRIRADRLDEWTDVLRAMKPKERPAHAGSLLWEGILRSSSRLPSRIVAVVSRPRSPELTSRNPYNLLRDAEIIAVGQDGAELPVQ